MGEFDDPSSSDDALGDDLMTATTPPPDPAEGYFACLIIPDIYTTAVCFTAVGRYQPTKPIEPTLMVATPTAEQKMPFKFVSSAQAPYRELIEEAPGSRWTAQPGTATHHLGLWVDDLRGTATELQKLGYRQEARASGNKLSMFVYYTGATGTRIELVDRALFPKWAAFPIAMSA